MISIHIFLFFSMHPLRQVRDTVAEFKVGPEMLSVLLVYAEELARHALEPLADEALVPPRPVLRPAAPHTGAPVRAAPVAPFKLRCAKGPYEYQPEAGAKPEPSAEGDRDPPPAKRTRLASRRSSSSRHPK